MYITKSNHLSGLSGFDFFVFPFLRSNKIKDLQAICQGSMGSTPLNDFF